MQTNWLSRFTQVVPHVFSINYIKKVLRGRVHYIYFRIPAGWVERKARIIMSDGPNGSQLLDLLRREKLQVLSETSEQPFTVLASDKEPIGELPNSRQIIVQKGKVRLYNNNQLSSDSLVVGKVQSPHKEIHLLGITTVRVAWVTLVCKIVLMLCLVKLFGDRSSLNLLQTGTYKLEVRDGRTQLVATR